MKEEVILKQIEREIRQFTPILSQAADAVLDQKVSAYPIFIVHQGEIELGLSVIDPQKVKSDWAINVSILEEFAAKQIIKAENIDNFREVYKDPETNLCLFVISEIGANFIFIPRKDIEAN
ncbi:MAG: hypothetical protein AAF960_14340 [Bacteroidota bacterium]